MKSFCEANCDSCELRTQCSGCVASDGYPFGEACMIASLCRQGEQDFPAFQQRLLDAFNRLEIEDMDTVTELYALKGSFINMELPLPSGQTAKFWNDNKIYLGSQLPKRGTERCYGIAADENWLMVCEYERGGGDPKLVVWKRWA